MKRNAKVRIVYFGSCKTPFIKAGIERFHRWIRPYLSMEAIALPSGGDIHRVGARGIQAREEELFFKRFSREQKGVLLCEEGENPDSQAFATWLENQISLAAYPLFVIAGYAGPGEQLKQWANTTLSLSRMTWTHEMAYLLLMEQLFRAMKIIRKEPYHY